MKSVVRILSILLMVAVWLRIDWLLGLRSLKRQRTASVYPWRKGKIDFFDDGVAWMKSLELDITEAEESICLLFYIIEPDEVGRRIFTLLKDRVKDGVRVRVLCDALGSRKMKPWLKHLKEAGIEIELSRPVLFKGSLFSIQRRNHRKIAVFDERVSHIGGFNIGREYVNLDPVLSPWRDYHLRIEGESVGDALKEFEIDWNREFNISEQASSPRQNTFKGHQKHQIIPSEPVNMEGFILDLFDQAEESIFIGTPYFIPTGTLFNSLKQKIRENIKVTIMVPGTPDHALVQPASYHFLRELIDLGAEVHQFEHGFYHAKVILIDDKLCDIGTTNFDQRSLVINDEINVLTSDKEIIGKVITSINNDLHHAVRVQKKDIQPNGPVDASAELLARSISHLL
ncbi:phospholipase D-like domain-containing protein [Jeotgalibacillus proteolyticus]|nr:phospholipase D-like domain-containing protein [Jeotgalibacillus proteolyticus]